MNFIKKTVYFNEGKTISKRLLNTLQAGPEIRVAKISVLSAVLFQGFLNNQPAMKLLLAPHRFTEDELIQLYTDLTGILNSTRKNRQQLEYNKNALGLPFPDFAIDLVKISESVIELWLATLISGVFPKLEPTARQAWNLINASRIMHDDALNELKETEQKSTELTGATGPMTYNEIDSVTCLEYSNMMPAFRSLS
ncbi:MAG: hypothetical protein HOO88_07165 [Kiritimatiellaceae bacterium]|nr:hypothetical protein [Kiritimatiellaceae bacterium]